jgi:hypothetical protein
MTDTKNYPFPCDEDDELKQRFNIDLRAHSSEQLDAAAKSWTAFCWDSMDATVFVKLLAVCEGSLSQATVLWDALRHHRSYGLKVWQEAAAIYYTKKFGEDFGSKRRYSEALQQLADDGLLVHWPVSANVPRKFRLDYVELSERLAEVSSKLPGLVSMPPQETI